MTRRGIDPLDPIEPVKDPLVAPDPQTLTDAELEGVTRPVSDFDPDKQEYKERAEMEMFRREQEKTMMAKSKQDKPIPQKSQNNDDTSFEADNLFLEGIAVEQCIECGGNIEDANIGCYSTRCDRCMESLRDFLRDANTQKNEEDSSSQESGGLLSKLNPF